MVENNTQGIFHLYGYARSADANYYQEPSYEERIAILKKHGETTKLKILEAAIARQDDGLIKHDINGDGVVNEIDQKLKKISADYSDLAQYNTKSLSSYLGNETSVSTILSKIRGADGYKELNEENSRLQRGLLLSVDPNTISDPAKEEELDSILETLGYSDLGEEEITTKLEQHLQDSNLMLSTFYEVAAKKYLTSNRDKDAVLDQHLVAIREQYAVTYGENNTNSDEEKYTSRQQFLGSIREYRSDYNADGISFDDHNNDGLINEEDGITDYDQNGIIDAKDNLDLLDQQRDNKFANQSSTGFFEDYYGNVFKIGGKGPKKTNIYIHKGQKEKEQKKIAKEYRKAIKTKIKNLIKTRKAFNKTEDIEKINKEILAWEIKQEVFEGYYKKKQYLKITEDFNLDGIIDEKDEIDRSGQSSEYRPTPVKPIADISELTQPKEIGGGIFNAFADINASGALENNNDIDHLKNSSVSLNNFIFNFNNNRKLNFTSTGNLNLSGFTNSNLSSNWDSISSTNLNNTDRLEELRQEQKTLKQKLVGTTGRDRVTLNAQIARIVKEISNIERSL